MKASFKWLLLGIIAVSVAAGLFSRFRTPDSLDIPVQEYVRERHCSFILSLFLSQFNGERASWINYSHYDHAVVRDTFLTMMGINLDDGSFDFGSFEIPTADEAIEQHEQVQRNSQAIVRYFGLDIGDGNDPDRTRREVAQIENPDEFLEHADYCLDEYGRSNNHD